MEVKIDKNDIACCSSDCDFKDELKCKLYNEELFGSLENPTRCGNCYISTKQNITITKTPLNFGDALNALKEGKRIARNGWNGNGMWLAIYKPQVLTVLNEKGDVCSKEYMLNGDVELKLTKAIYMKTADEKFVPWLPSQADIFAEDWEIINSEKRKPILDGPYIKCNVINCDIINR